MPDGTEPEAITDPAERPEDWKERRKKLHGTSLGRDNDGWDGPNGEETEPPALVLTPEEAESGDYDDVDYTTVTREVKNAEDEDDD